jgi:hypothetical protein
MGWFPQKDMEWKPSLHFVQNQNYSEPGKKKNGGKNMEKTLSLNWLKEKQTGHSSLARGIGWGLLGGLAGTLVMDILLMSGLSAMSLPAFTCFTIVGDTVAKFFSLFDFEVAGDIPTGAATHYVIGPLVGAIYGAGVAKIKAFRAKTVKRCLLQAIVYVEILSQPILAMTPIL